MSDTQTAARGRKEWMPNRMFDPVANPFAIQNLLEKKVETFVELRDERGDATFTFDTVVMANPVHAFTEQAIEDPAAGENAFQAEWMDAGHEFADEASAAAGDFVAGQAGAATGFHAEGDAGVAGDALVDAPVDAPAEAVADEKTHAGAEDESGALTAAQASVANSDEAAQAAMNEGMTGAAGATGATGAADASAADAAAHAAAHAAATDAAMNMADAGEAAPAIAAETAQAAVAAEAGSAAVAAAAAAAEEAPPVAAQPGLSDEELQARLEAAREEGRAEVRETVRAEAHQQGHDEGHAAGYAQAKEELGKDYEEKITQLQAMLNAMQALSYNPDAMFEPMKTLSVHIAEQLVRGELTQSPQVISRLVDNCLRELNASGEKAVIIHLHPEDLEQYKPQAAQFGDALVLRADPKLERGSVRASLDGSVVEDLIQRRVAGLKKGLVQAPAPSWRANAGRLSDRIAEGQRGSQQVEDVTIAAARQEAEARLAAKPDVVTEAEALADAAADSAVDGLSGSAANNVADNVANSAADNANA